MSVKQFMMYQMFNFLCGKRENVKESVKGNESVKSIKNIKKPNNRVNSANFYKISPEFMKKSSSKPVENKTTQLGKKYIEIIKNYPDDYNG